MAKYGPECVRLQYGWGRYSKLQVAGTDKGARYNAQVMERIYFGTGTAKCLRDKNDYVYLCAYVVK